MVMGKVPDGLSEAVAMVSFTPTGLPDVGCALDGWKLHAAPLGKPEQARFTVPLNSPNAFTWNCTGGELLGSLTAMLEGEGAVRAKSTTCKLSGIVNFSWLASIPSA